ncbi:MAG: hypothetical protein ACRD4E_14710, partial [Bryobacteraceae bacterium]
VHVRHVGEVQQNFPLALIDEAVDLVLQQFIALTQGDLPLEVEHYHVADRTFLDVHGLVAPDP